MRYALVNPNWSFDRSTYFGCKDPHIALELLFARQQLEAAGHEVLLVDAFLADETIDQVRAQLEAFHEDYLVVPTAPSYLFWRCPQPELRVPMEWIGQLGRGATTVVIGPHGSATPRATLQKTGGDVVLKGEPDQTLGMLATHDWEQIPGCCWMKDDEFHCAPGLGVTDMKLLGALDFKNYPVERHRHMHHVFPDGTGRGAELEFARGCPWNCTFCNKTLFRNKYRERDVDAVLAEIDLLTSRGVEYIYFIDEIFGVGKNVKALLEGIAARNVKIGFQSRIDLWDEESLDLLGRARCISVECGIESITEEGRDKLNKNCKLSTDRISELLIYARKRIPWVQANLIRTEKDDLDLVRAWQARLKAEGVWVSEPVPMFPFPGSPLYVETFGTLPDDQAWERAHRYYLNLFGAEGYSDIQEQHPAAIEDLECTY